MGQDWSWHGIPAHPNNHLQPCYYKDPIQNYLHKRRWLPKFVRAHVWHYYTINFKPLAIFGSWLGFVFVCSEFGISPLDRYWTLLAKTAPDKEEREEMYHRIFSRRLIDWDVHDYANLRPEMDMWSRRQKYPQYYGEMEKYKRDKKDQLFDNYVKRT